MTNNHNLNWPWSLVYFLSDHCLTAFETEDGVVPESGPGYHNYYHYQPVLATVMEE